MVLPDLCCISWIGITLIENLGEYGTSKLLRGLGTLLLGLGIGWKVVRLAEEGLHYGTIEESVKLVMMAG